LPRHSQAVRLWQHYRQGARDKEVVVIGLHTVFEHHHVMTPAALTGRNKQQFIRVNRTVNQSKPTLGIGLDFSSA
jgi:hypothetical protein